MQLFLVGTVWSIFLKTHHFRTMSDHSKGPGRGLWMHHGINRLKITTCRNSREDDAMCGRQHMLVGDEDAAAGVRRRSYGRSWP